MRSSRKIPRFATEEQEREFWSSHDSTDYIEYSKAQKVLFPALKPSTRTISIRLPESLLARLKAVANKRDIPYQSLIKMYLFEMLKKERAQTEG